MPRKILIVDDEPDVELLVRQIFRKQIRSKELKFLFAANGLEALNNLRTEKELDLVLTDINMPEMDGLTLLSKINELNSDLIKSIIISAYDDMDNIRKAMNYGAFDFITKPLDIHDVEFTVEKALEHVQKIKENLRLREERDLADAHSQAKSRFLSTMSHEIRVPLNAILGMTELLRETELSPSQKQSIQVLEIAGETLLDLVNNILDLSKIEAGHLELEYIDFDIRNFIQNIMRMMAVRCDETDVQLTAHIHPNVPEYVKGDSARLRQILINLIGNAIKFTKAGEIKVDVQLSSAGKDSEFVFCVSDTGIGIPSDKLEKIFETFSQAYPSTSRYYGGTGLGLAICKSLIVAMDGQIRVESQLNTGSKFYFTVVMKPGSKSKTSSIISADLQKFRHIEKSLQTPDHCKLRILLADDSEHNRMILKHHLRPFSNHIDCAENGKIAVSLIKSNKYDLVLMDIQMPMMDGHAATRAIRKWESENDKDPTIIIVLTAYALKDEIRAVLDSGCTATLTKPLRKSKLLNVIDKFCLTPDRGPTGNVLTKRESDPIRIPSSMRILVQRYLCDMTKEVQRCFDHLEKNDLEEVKIFGHRLRGSGGAYGFNQLTVLGASIEKSAAGCDRESTYKSVKEVKEYLDAVCVTYD